jgi:hypothetical protein
MANQILIGNDYYVTLSREEALEIVMLMTAQLAGVRNERIMTGSCPTVTVRPEEGPAFRLSFALAADSQKK